MSNAAIDTVIISHYHGDHMNGLLKADNTPAFPNAEILVPANEHKYWMDDGEMSRAPKGRIEGLFKNARRVFSGDVAKRVRTYEWDKEVVPGVMAVGTPGHSPGHTSFVVSSGSSKVFVQSDLTHVPYLFVRNPGWHAFYDQDAVMAEATRRKMLDMLAAEKMMVQGFHFPFPAQAYIEKTATGYREVHGAVERRRSDLSGFASDDARGRPRGRPFRRRSVTGNQANVIAADKPPQSGSANDRIPSAPTARRGRRIIFIEGATS